MTLILAVWLALAAVAEAQTIVGSQFELSTGPCTIRSGSGAPASGLGAVCDTYYQTNSPYAVYTKTGAATWTAGLVMPASAVTGDLITAASASTLGRLADVATGQVLISGGVGVAPAYSATPTVSTLTATTAGTGTVSMESANPVLRWLETDGGTDSKNWNVRTNGQQMLWRASNDATTVNNDFITISRTGASITGITLQPDGGDIILGPGGNDILPSTGYTKNLGALTNKYLTLHAAELWVETLVAQNTIATIGGRVLVGPTTILAVDLASGGTTITVKHNQMTSGDRVYMEANGKVEFMAITSGAGGTAGAYTYSVTRNLDGSGGGADAWFAGDAVFNTGQTGKGYIDLYSVSGVNAASTSGPTIVGNVRTGSTYSAIEPRWAIGNLNGLYGYGVDTYGAAFGDNANAWVKIDPTNGVRIGENATTYFSVDPAGNALFAGQVTIGTGRNMLANTISAPTVRPQTSDGDGTDWGTITKTHAFTVTHACNLDNYRLENSAGTPTGGSCYASVVSTAGAGTYTIVSGPTLPVAVGTKYEFSAYLGVHDTGGVGFVQLVWLTNAGTALSSNDGTTVAGGVLGGVTLAQWGRSGVVAVAPATATQVQPRIALLHSGANANTFLMYMRLLLAEAQPGQTAVSPWAPGGMTAITGEYLATDTVISDVVRSTGAATLTSGTGFWIHANDPAATPANTPTFRVGNPAGNRLSWNGTDLTLVSATATLNANGLTLVPGATIGSYATIFTNGYKFTIPNGGMGMFGSDVATGERRLRLESAWDGVGNFNSGQNVTVSMIAMHAPSSGGTTNSATLAVYASSTQSVIDLNASIVTVAGVTGAGTGKLVCVKGGTGGLGTCNATTINTSTCTCS